MYALRQLSEFTVLSIKSNATDRAQNTSAPSKSMSLESLHRNLQANYVTHPSLRRLPDMFSHRRIVLKTSADIRDANDAHVVLEAVRLNILPLIKRRLVASERAQLKSGNIFVWEEGEDSEEGGLLRWTEGKRWWELSAIGRLGDD